MCGLFKHTFGRFSAFSQSSSSMADLRLLPVNIGTASSYSQYQCLVKGLRKGEPHRSNRTRSIRGRGARTRGETRVQTDVFPVLVHRDVFRGVRSSTGTVLLANSRNRNAKRNWFSLESSAATSGSTLLRNRIDYHQDWKCRARNSVDER